MTQRKPKRTTPRSESGEHTRMLLLTTAEQLFAERGMSVSERTIGSCAGQANKSVVSYYFGSREKLVLAISQVHNHDIEKRREVMVASLGSESSLADWLHCIVKPITDHLQSLGAPTWYARFTAGCLSDIALRKLIFEDASASQTLQTVFAEVNARLPSLTPNVQEARGFMTQHLIIGICADYERALQAKTHSPYTSWQDVCDMVVDALLGLWHAPVSADHQPSNPRAK